MTSAAEVHLPTSAVARKRGRVSIFWSEKTSSTPSGTKGRYFILKLEKPGESLKS